MTSKKLIYGALVAIIVILPIAWYLISPVFIDVEADETSPLDSLTVGDALDTMSSEEKDEFDQAVQNMADKGKTMDESMDSEAMLLAEGLFKPRAHEVKGKALLIDDGTGNKIIRFEDFETINGPNLHIYLASDLSDGDFVDLGEIKATKGNVNYELPEGIDFEKYNKVLVWCVPFKVLFSYADLTI